MFEYYQNKLCVHGGWLYNDAGVMSFNNYKNLTNRRSLNVIRRGGNGRSALVVYDSLPERFKQIIIDKFGDPYKTTKHNRFRDLLVTDIKAEAFYKDYTLPNGTALPEKNINEYIANASILNTVKTVVNMRKSSAKSLGGRAKKLWEAISEVIQNLPRHTYPHSLPKNVRRLKEKYKAYHSNGYEALIHKGFCNDNSEKINKEASFWVLARWSDRVARVVSLNQLLFEYNEKALKEGWKQLKDENTLRLFLYKDGVKHLWYGHRYGDVYAKEKFTYHHTTKLPSMRDSLWYSDGTKLNLYYLNKDGKIETCQVYEVMDAFSEVFLGYHISKTENYEAQFKAYKMAIKISGHKPYQIGFDGQGGHKKLKSGDFLTKVARLAIKTTPYNGKSKTIESAFGRFQKQFLAKYWNFTGQNITAKSISSKAHREMVLANKDSLPNFKEVVEIYKNCRKEWNEAAHPKSGMPRLEMYLNSQNPETPQVTLWDMVDLFWLKRPKKVTCTPGGISFRENKVEYKYMVYKDGYPNVEWLRMNIDKKFIIKFDPDDMSMIYLYEDTPLGIRFVCEATTKIEIHRGKQEQEEFEAEYIQKIKELNDDARLKASETMDEILEEHGMLPEQYGLKSPGLLGLKSKNKKQPADIGKVIKLESQVSELEAQDEDDQATNIYKQMLQ